MDRRTAYAGGDIAPRFVPEECNSRLCDDVIKTITQHAKSDEKKYGNAFHSINSIRESGDGNTGFKRFFKKVNIVMILNDIVF